MSGMELLVVIVFLLLGYWIMSAVLNWLSGRGPKPGQGPEIRDPDAED